MKRVWEEGIGLLIVDQNLLDLCSKEEDAAYTYILLHRTTILLTRRMPKTVYNSPRERYNCIGFSALPVEIVPKTQNTEG